MQPALYKVNRQHPCYTSPEVVDCTTIQTDLMQNYPILGLDISKETLDACLLEAAGTHRSVHVQNTPAGFRKLVSWLAPYTLDAVTVCLEATNVYGVAVTTFFYKRQATVYVVNPAAVSHFMHSELRRVKTDKADAEAIAHFALTHRLQPWQPQPEHYQELRDLVRRLYALTKSRVRIQNRMEKVQYLTSAARTVLLTSLKEELHFYTLAIKKLYRSITSCLERHADLHERFALLTSAPGVGPVTALTVMAELPNIEQFSSAKQVAAYAGLTPRIRHSGKHRPDSQPISKIGNAQLRHALYMSALTAKRSNEHLRNVARRLRDERGKKPKVVIIAIARRLLHLLYAMEKHQAPFDPNYHKLQLTPGTV